MNNERLLDLIDELLGFLSRKYDYSGMIEIAGELGFTEEELRELGWITDE